MEHKTKSSFKSLINQGLFRNSLNIDHELLRLQRTLVAVKECEILKPARLYHAYREYSIQFGTHQLKLLYLASTVTQKSQILSLIQEYNSLKTILHI